MRSKSARNGYLALDEERGAWETSGMNERARRSFVLFAIAIGLCQACRERGADSGIGGQSGDEGRRAPWLGSGGATSGALEWEPPLGR